ncbi:MAG: flagellar basal body P-ring formation chaperone FlgA [Desulfobacteraceae bacterium]|nr:flagellar basal body P-ring formation chaperone FlgA [Desulfobacteraceae bacterium]
MRTGIFHKYRVIRTCVVLAGVLALWAVTPALGQQNILIQVKQNTLVHHDVICLGEIADIQADDFLRNALAKIELGRSPRPGDLSQLDKQRIITLIQSQSYLSPGQVTLESPDHIYVKRASQTIDRQRIQSEVDQILSDRFKDRQYTISGLTIRGLKTYPAGEIKLTPDVRNLVNRNGRLSVYLDVWVNNEKQNRLAVSGTLEVLLPVVCAEKNLGRGEKISVSDVVVKKKNLFDLDKGFVTRPEEIEGMALRTDLDKGQVLTMRMLEKAPVIRKGDIISLVAKKGGMVIVTSGISQEDGYLNTAISVENSTSGRQVRGLVKSKTRVQVLY